MHEIKTWSDLEFWNSTKALDLLDQVHNQKREEWDKFFTPSQENVFKAFELCPYHKTKVVILGQDPYPTKGHANGLAFSVNKDVSPLPASLRNIFSELVADVGCPYPPHGDLSQWAKQGCLLLNTSLTTAIGKPGKHLGLGWEALAEEVISSLWGKDIVFVLWGKKAWDVFGEANNCQIYKPFNANQNDYSWESCIITNVHPSPLSARKGFLGSKPFSTCNTMLRDMKREPIDWEIK